MNKLNKTLLIIALAVVIVLFLFFGSVFMNRSYMNQGMMMQGGNSGNGGFGWMLIPTIFMLGFGILIGWLIFAKKK